MTYVGFVFLVSARTPSIDLPFAILHSQPVVTLCSYHRLLIIQQIIKQFVLLSLTPFEVIAFTQSGTGSVLCRVSWRGMQLIKQSSHYYLYTVREFALLRRSILNCIGIKNQTLHSVGKLKVQGLKKLTFSNIILNRSSIP